ncbi:MAG TPA: hypothetical protein PKJ16_05820, partial [Spirochaetota bacterium]|nr:hypothetical protein [Spirochaetota bacterium]
MGRLRDVTATEMPPSVAQQTSERDEISHVVQLRAFLDLPQHFNIPLVDFPHGFFAFDEGVYPEKRYVDTVNFR